LQGEFEDAIESYREAIALDDTYLEAMLNAAEVYIHPLGEFDEAIRMCDQALDLAENDDELVDTLLLKFDALLGMGQLDAAKSLCARFPEGPFENPNHTFLVGRALYETGALDRAAPLIEEAAKKSPKNSEATYYLGLVRDERGDVKGATEAFLSARELDLELPAPVWTLTRETFEDTARTAVAALPDELKRFIRENEVYAADVPGVEVVVDGVDPRALLLLDGVNATEASTYPTARLFVYQRNVERLAGSVELVQSEILAALERELTLTFVDNNQELLDKAKQQLN
jgi:tetratricopeptide (TPR) repeat protein